MMASTGAPSGRSRPAASFGVDAMNRVRLSEAEDFAREGEAS
jgi:hypothetical protein